MKNRLQGFKSILFQNLSINVLVLLTLLYFCVMSFVKQNYVYGALFLITGIVYVYGAKLAGIRKYLPLVLSILASLVFVVGFVFVLFRRPVPIGMAAFASVVIFYVLTGFGGIAGSKCIPYAVAMFGAEIVLSFNGDSRGMIMLIAALAISIVFASATYTAMSKYVFTVFLSIAMVKITGIWHILRGTSAEGLADALIKSPILYFVMVFLGIVSLLLIERHPRIKSDRDKKEVPALRQWQIIIGVSIMLMVFFGVSNFYSVFDMNLTGIDGVMKINLIYLVGSTMTDGSLMTKILEMYGFIPLMFVIMTMVSFVYKALCNYKESGKFEDRLYLLMMLGFLLTHMYYNICIPVLLLFALMAGCVVNGESKSNGESGR